MKPKSPNLLKIRATLSQAVGRLDLRGSNQSITEALCIIDAVMDASLSGEPISASKAHSLGKTWAALAKQETSVEVGI